MSAIRAKVLEEEGFKPSQYKPQPVTPQKAHPKPEQEVPQIPEQLQLQTPKKTPAFPMDDF